MKTKRLNTLKYGDTFRLAGKDTHLYKGEYVRGKKAFRCYEVLDFYSPKHDTGKATLVKSTTIVFYLH
jgi:hypothetical protein